MAYGERFVICNLSEEIRTFKMNLHHSETPVLASMSFPTACDASGFRLGAGDCQGGIGPPTESSTGQTKQQMYIRVK